jgi:16S rRNA (guanine527-N7)-methyltransferase
LGVAATDANRAAARQRLTAGAAELGIDLSARQLERFMVYLDLLAQWGASFNLTAVRDPLQMVTVHLLDSLSILPLIAALAPKRLIDIGSGAGLPGIPLALMLPELEVALLDSVQKKTAFQIQAKGALKLSNCHPINGRMQALTFAKPYDLAVCRAFASVADAALLAERALCADGTLIAMKGHVPKEELDALAPAWRLSAVTPLVVPGLDARRCAVVLRRARATNSGEAETAGANA